MKTASIEQDIQQHIEDDITVNAVRIVNGLPQLVEVPWNHLTEEERRAANCVTFQLYDVCA